MTASGLPLLASGATVCRKGWIVVMAVRGFSIIARRGAACRSLTHASAASSSLNAGHVGSYSLTQQRQQQGWFHTPEPACAQWFRLGFAMTLGVAALGMQPSLAETSVHAEASETSSFRTSPEDASAAARRAATAQWRIYTDRGRELVSQGDYEGAERFLKRAVELAKEGFGPDDPHAGSAAHNLAELYRVRGDFGSAEPLFREALRVLVAAYGEEDVRVAFALHSLAGLHYAQGHWAEAADLYREAANVKRRALGPSHEETINSSARLAETLWAAGRKEDALRTMRSVVTAGGDTVTPANLRRRGRLADMLLQVGSNEEAEAHLRAILDYAQREQETELGSYAQAAEALSTALQASGRFEQADRMMNAALEARIRSVGDTREHVAVAGALRRYAVLLLREVAHRTANNNDDGKTAENRALSERAVQLARQAADTAAGLLASAESPNIVARVMGWFRPAGELGELARRVNCNALRLESAACEATLGEALVAAGDAGGGKLVLQRTLIRLEAWIDEVQEDKSERKLAASRWLMQAGRLRDSVRRVLNEIQGQ